VCAAYHAVVEGGTPESSGFEGGHFESLAGHISAPHAAFVAHWMGLVDWEEAGARARRSGMWALPGGAGLRCHACIYQSGAPSAFLGVEGMRRPAAASW
jgi:hypothetical protein